MKKILALLLVVCMVACLFAGCKKDEGSIAKTEETGKAETEKTLRFVYVSPLLSDPIWLFAKDGFEKACSELGVDGSWVGPQGISAEEMAQLVDTAVGEKVDGIITQSICPATPINNAVAAGVPVMMVEGIPEGCTGVTGLLGKDLEKEGQLLYEEACKYIGQDEKIYLSIQCTALNAEFYVNQNAAVVAAFENHPGGFELCNITTQQNDKAHGADEWLNSFNTYPDINVCVNLASTSGASCVIAADELGITDDLVIFAVDDTEESLQYVRDGSIKGTIVVSFWNYGYMAARWLYQNITEGRVPEKETNDAGTMLVTKENIDNYNELLKASYDLPEKK